LELLATSLELIFLVFSLAVVSQDLVFLSNQMREGTPSPPWLYMNHVEVI
jgi:hypothetical protein